MTPGCLVAISIDVECDKDQQWAVRRPLGFRGVEQGIGERLVPLFAQYGARPTYLVSPEVIRDDHSSRLLAGLADCELGAHLHPEFVWSSDGVAVTEAVASALAEEEERRDLQELTRTFTETFHRPPRSYRAGRYGASARTLGLLAELGYLVDTSVTPHKCWDYGPDFRQAPERPYFPAAADLTVVGAAGGVLEIPITLRGPRGPWFLRPLARPFATSKSRRVRHLAGRLLNPVWFRPGWARRSELLSFVRVAAREEGGVLNMMFHNVDLVAGCSPSAASEASVRAALDDLNAVLEETLARGGRFATLSEVRSAWEPTWANH